MSSSPKGSDSVEPESLEVSESRFSEDTSSEVVAAEDKEKPECQIESEDEYSDFILISLSDFTSEAKVEVADECHVKGIGGDASDEDVKSDKSDVVFVESCESKDESEEKVSQTEAQGPEIGSAIVALSDQTDPVISSETETMSPSVETASVKEKSESPESCEKPDISSREVQVEYDENVVSREKGASSGVISEETEKQKSPEQVVQIKSDSEFSDVQGKVEGNESSVKCADDTSNEGSKSDKAVLDVEKSYKPTDESEKGPQTKIQSSETGGRVAASCAQPDSVSSETEAVPPSIESLPVEEKSECSEACDKSDISSRNDQIEHREINQAIVKGGFESAAYSRWPADMGYCGYVIPVAHFPATQPKVIPCRWSSEKTPLVKVSHSYAQRASKRSREEAQTGADSVSSETEAVPRRIESPPVEEKSASSEACDKSYIYSRDVLIEIREMNVVEDGSESAACYQLPADMGYGSHRIPVSHIPGTRPEPFQFTYSSQQTPLVKLLDSSSIRPSGRRRKEVETGAEVLAPSVSESNIVASSASEVMSSQTESPSEVCQKPVGNAFSGESSEQHSESKRKTVSKDGGDPTSGEDSTKPLTDIVRENLSTHVGNLRNDISEEKENLLYGDKGRRLEVYARGFTAKRNEPTIVISENLFRISVNVSPFDEKKIECRLVEDRIDIHAEQRWEYDCGCTMNYIHQTFNVPPLVCKEKFIAYIHNDFLCVEAPLQLSEQPKEENLDDLESSLEQDP